MAENAEKDAVSSNPVSTVLAEYDEDSERLMNEALLEEELSSRKESSDLLRTYMKRLSSAEPLTAEKESALWEEISRHDRKILGLLSHFGCVYAHFLLLLEQCREESDLGDLFAQSLFSGKDTVKKFFKRLPALRQEYGKLHEDLYVAYLGKNNSALSKLHKKGEKLLLEYPMLRELMFREVASLQNHRLVVESGDAAACEQLLNTELLCDRESFCACMDLLSEEIRQTDLLRECLVEGNLRLVISITKHYQGRGIPFLDLIQEGNMGLLKAIEKFDFQLGHRFSTYATWWIKQSAAHAVRSQSRVIRLPIHMLSTLSKINKAEQQFLQEHGREGSVEEIASMLDLTRSKVSSLKRMALQSISLQAPVYSWNSGRETTLEETIKDIHDGDTPAKSLAKKMLAKKLHTLLDGLPERTRQILIFRFGLNGVEPMSLNEMSQHFHISRERIRQIENNALMHLRNPEMISMLEDYFL